MPRKAQSSLELALVGLLFVALMILSVAILGKPWRPPVASVHGHGVDLVITYLLVATGVLFVAGHLLLAAFVWRYRGDGPSIHRPIAPRFEWITALVPVLLMTVISEVGVLAIGRPVWGQVYGPPPADAFRAELVGKQFAWTARYPGKDGKLGRTDPKLIDDENQLGLDKDDPAAKDDIVEIGVLRLPQGRPIYLSLRSQDVQHSFSVAAFRVKQDLVPGLVQHARFVPEVAGSYEIACSQLCGLGHYRMRGLVNVMAPHEFDEWLSEQSSWMESY